MARVRGIKQPHPLGSVASRAGVQPLTAASGGTTSSSHGGVKISALPVASAANDIDQFEVNQGGTSRRVTVDQLGERIAASDWIQDQIDGIVVPLPPTTLPPSGPASGDLTGIYPGPTIKSGVALLGVPTAATAAVSTNTDQIATTAFVQAAIAAIPAPQFLDPDTVSWRTSVLANGGVVSNAQLTAIDNLIVALRTVGAYNLMDDIWLLASESSIQTLTSLKQRRLATAMNAPTFSKRGTVFNGTTQYIRTGFIPATHSLAMTGSLMQASVWCMVNTGAGTTPFAALTTSTSNVLVSPRTGGNQYSLQLNSNSGSFGTSNDSTGFTSAYRTGSTFGMRKNAADLGTVVPASSTTTPSTHECYIGARNNAGTADSLYNGMIGIVFVGADITLAREPAAYAAFQAYLQATGAFDAYVAAAGSDSNPGTATLPYLTWDKGYAGTSAGATLWLDGTTASPSTYRSATTTALAKAITVRAINPLGAIIAGAGTAIALRVNPTGGETIALRDVIVDAAANTGGPAGRLIDLLPSANTFTLNCTNCLFRGWSGASSYGIYQNGASGKANLNLTNCTFTGDSCSNAVTMVQMIAGTTTITGCTFNITNQNLSGFGVIKIAATAVGVGASITNSTINHHVGNLAGPSGHFTVFTENVAGVLVSGNTMTASSISADRSISGVWINTNESGTATELPCSNSQITNNTLLHDVVSGGVGFDIGGEAGGDKTKNVGGLIQGNSFTGSASSMAGGVHGIMLCDATTGTMRGNTVDYASIGMVDKLCLGSLVENNTVSRCNSSYDLIKGSVNSTHRNNIITASFGFAAFGLDIHDGDAAEHSTGAVISTGSYANSGAVAYVFVRVQALNTATFDHSHYVLNSGTLHATAPFQYQTTNYATFAAWQAAQEPTAAANFP